MQKNSTTFYKHEKPHRKRKLFSKKHFFLFFLLLNALIFGQNFTTFGNGTGSNSSLSYPTPFANYYYGNREQFLIPASELSANSIPGGSYTVISSIAFNIVNLNSCPALNNSNVKIYTTSTSNPLSTGWVTGTAVAVANIGTFTPVVGWNTITLDNTFIWNGTDQIVIEICTNNAGYIANGNAGVQWTTNLSGNTYSKWYRDDSTSVCGSTSSTGTSTNTRPNIRLGWTYTGTCGIPTLSEPSLITANTATLNWTAPTTAPADGYEYYYSTTNTAPVNSAAINTANLVTSTSANLSNLSPYTSYYYWVRSVCSTSENSVSPWIGGSSFKTACVSPDSPTELMAGGATTSGATLDWTPSNASAYVAFISTSTTPPALVNGTVYTSGTTYTLNGIDYKCVYNNTSAFVDITGLSSNTSYNVFVYGRNGASSTDCVGAPWYSASGLTGTLTTLIMPSYAMGASDIGNTSVTINWTKSEIGGGASPISYQYDVATDNAFTNIIASASGLTTDMANLTGLTANTTYYFREKTTSLSTYSTTTFATSAGYTPINLTGFNQDVVANGTQSALSTTTSDVDGVDYAFFGSGFTNSTSTYTGGLPSNQVLTSVAAPVGLKYFLKSYQDNNVLRLPISGNSGTLTLTKPQPFTNLYIGGTSGSGGPSTFTVLLNFADGTSQTITGLSMKDWYGGTGYIAYALGRVKLSTNAVETSTTNPRIYVAAIAVDAENQSKLLNSITITSTTGISTGTGNILNFFAVSGIPAVQCEGTPASLNVALSATSGGFSSTFTTSATNIPTAAGISYQWQSSANGTDNWTDITGATNAVSTITAVDFATTTYYRLVSTCSYSSESSYSNIVTYTTSLVYCTPTYANGYTNWRPTIFAIPSLSFSDTIPSGDTDRTDITIPALNAGTTYTMNATTIGWVSIGLAIDFGNDGSFGQAGDVLATPEYEAQDTHLYTMEIPIPEGTPTGNYRLRIWAREANAWSGINPCGAYGYGSFADYVIHIVGNCVQTITSVTGDTVCSGTQATLTAVGNDDTTAFNWYDAPTEGNLIATTTTGSYTTGTLTATTSYFVSATNGVCSSDRSEVVATVNTTDAPTGEATQTFCSGATIEDLIVTGTAVIWYTTENGDTVVSPETILIDQTTYYASQTNECESIERLAVTANITSVEAPSGETTQSSCEVSTIGDIVVAGEGIIWYDAATEGTVLSTDTEVVGNTTYYASQTIDGCESVERLAVYIDNCLLIGESNASQFNVYPNPVKDILTVESKIAINKIEVYALNGQLIKSFNNLDKKQTTLDVSSLTTASYILKIKTKDGVKTVKFVKK